MMKNESKTFLRKKFREIRKKIPSAYRDEASKKAATLFAQNSHFRDNKTFSSYLPLLDEFNSLPLIEMIWKEKKQCYVPVLEKDDEKILSFVHYKYGDALHMNRYGILEPVNKTQKISKDNLDIIILPLIAFDRYGRRLGTGSGYYDKTFSFMKDIVVEKKPQMIGLGYAVQEADELPEDPWDILLEYMLTENGLITSLKIE